MKKRIILLLAALTALLSCSDSGFERDNPWDAGGKKWNGGYWTLTIEKTGDCGTVSLPVGANKYYEEISVPVRASAGGDCEFTGWTGELNIKDANVTITMNGDKTLTANFQRLSVTQPTTYTITFNVNGGNALTTDTATTGTDGKLASLPTPTRTNYTFKGWWTVSAATGGDSVTVNWVYNADDTVYARWEEVTDPPTPTYTLIIAVNMSAGGSVTPEAGTHTYNAGESVTVEATENSGYTFQNWTAVSGSLPPGVNATSAEITFNINSDVNIMANFEQVVQPPDTGSNFTGTVDGVEFSMVYVSGGTFEMGCTDEQGSDCYSDESPAHNVTLSNYYVGRYEVTQGLYKAVMGSLPSSISSSYGMGDNYPVYYVSWYDIQDFINELNAKTGKNYRLPTEAEWEFAARGGRSSKNYRYSGSDSIDEVAWYYGNSSSKTHPVGEKQPNELGIYDMSGNVWEWVSDWYGSNYYSSSPGSNPPGPTSGSYRVDRGGSWHNVAGDCRVANRGDYYPDYRLRFGVPPGCVPLVHRAKARSAGVGPVQYVWRRGAPPSSAQACG